MKMALEPEWEAKFAPNTYGFRPGRSCHDAIEAIFITMVKKTAYVLDADIAECFDKIDQNVLLEKLNTTPTFKRIIKGWLNAGVMEDRKFISTPQGTIQGGTISPLLACVALHGLEDHIKKELSKELFQFMKKKRGKASCKEAQRYISVIFYADDFVVIHEDEEIIKKAKVIVETWLKTIGLELKPSKTKISHTVKGDQPGFDFLGFNIRHVPTKHNKKGYKLSIKPSHKSSKHHNLKIKHKLKQMRGMTQEVVIKELNSIIKGWSQYYASSIGSKRNFSRMDDLMHKKLWKWAMYRHPNKGKRWIKRRYFKKYGNDNWRFMTSNKITLIKHGDHDIKKHVKVQGTRSPYDGDWIYWGNRLKKIPDKSPRVIKLLNLQQGKCDYCQLWFKHDDILEIHHRDRNRRNNTYQNLSMLHGHCHDELHRRCA
ncbi:group II intron reverse transcriptase/maturase [Cardinium endosymbiont of Sogatella furcifera]|nr:group II intron reverse transcriptase/maturase [Cardinium endosymbiont of Sogatella furcifera]